MNLNKYKKSELIEIIQQKDEEISHFEKIKESLKSGLGSRKLQMEKIVEKKDKELDLMRSQYQSMKDRLSNSIAGLVPNAFDKILVNYLKNKKDRQIASKKN